jgi:hypothetical protein
MIESFKKNLDSIFMMEEYSSDRPMDGEDFQLNTDSMIIPDNKMKRMLDSGEASKNIVLPGSRIENSETLRQIGKYVYVKFDNPKYTSDDDKILWVIKSPKTRTNVKTKT